MPNPEKHLYLKWKLGIDRIELEDSKDKAFVTVSAFCNEKKLRELAAACEEAADLLADREVDKTQAALAATPA